MAIHEFFLKKLESNDPNLTQIDMRGGFAALTSDDMKQLAKIAKDNPHLKRVLLDENEIGDGGCEYLSELKYVEVLTLCDNNISSEGAEWLSKMRALRELSVPDNHIDDEGFALLLKVPTIESLIISGNPISPEGARLALKNTTLTELFLDNDQLDKPLLQEIAQHIKRNKNKNFANRDENNLPMNARKPEPQKSSEEWEDVTQLTSASWESDTVYSDKNYQGWTIWDSNTDIKSQEGVNQQSGCKTPT